MPDADHAATIASAETGPEMDGLLRPPRWEHGLAVGIAVLSLVVAWVVTSLSAEALPPAAHYPAPQHFADYTGTQALFRWDSGFYYDLVQHGYSYDGEKKGESNIVFAPLFPLCVRALAPIFGDINAGFVWAHVAFLVGAWLCWWVMVGWYGRRIGWLTLIGLGFSAGSFSFHAYYSESTMLLMLALCLLCLQRRWHLGLLIAAAILGSSRTTAAPFCVAFACWYGWQAWLAWRAEPRQTGRAVGDLAAMPGVFLGLAAYLGYLWLHFGNPFQLLPAIQNAAWGRYHQPIPLWEWATGYRLFAYWHQALLTTQNWLTDFKATNLLWTSLAVVAAWYGIWRMRRDWAVPLGFLGYAGLIYLSNIGSDYLISTHRFFVMMLPIYVMVGDTINALARRRLTVTAWCLTAAWVGYHLCQYVVYLTRIERGHWFYF